MAPVWAALAILATGALLHAQRELSWRALDVKARLDADGRLVVVERHAMVFTGDWNGGERSFRVGPGQHFALGAVRRIDPATGAATILIAGDLDEVDRFALMDRTTLRWRSRRPSDPPFDHDEIDYEIGYTLSGILLKEGDTYVLDHNFAMPEADKTIESLTVDLELDPIWIAPADFPGHREVRNLAPGANFVVHAALSRAAGPAPAAVRVGTTRTARLLVFAVLLGGVLVMVVRFARREASLGRFAPVVPPDAIDAAWLDAHVFSLLPEEAGALWDDKVGAPEVAALLARLTAEDKITTTPDAREMTMRLAARRSAFHGYEDALIRGLFFGERNETSTSAIKAHYRTSGFDPAAKIKPGLLQKLAGHADFQDRSQPPSRKATSCLLAAGGLLLGWNVVSGAIDVGEVIGLGIAALFLWGPAAIGAKAYQKRVDGLVGWPLWFGIVPVLYLVRGWSDVAAGGTSPVTVLLGQSLVHLGVVNSLFNIAKAREGAKKIARRKELAAARRFFARELAAPSPRLQDAWFPWLLAFGLGPKVDRWFRAFGGTNTAADTAVSSASSASSHSGSWSGGGSFSDAFGGGRSGGAGASASWAAAASSLAAGVSAPSSSSSGSSSGGGGGGGGGGSSGGGGGGGW